MPHRCPSCGRPVAVARPRCLYCGAALAAAAVAAVERARAEVTPALPEAPPARRVVMVVDLDGQPAERIATALGLSLYEAGQRARRGGLQLHRLIPPGEADAEVERIAAAGLAVFSLPEAQVRQLARPQIALGGGYADVGLSVQTSTGDATIAPGDVLLVVRGPITREYQPVADDAKRLRTATLEQGYRIHLHRRRQLEPLELDPANFDFGALPPLGASLMQLSSWAETVSAGAPADDAFRRLPPALAPAQPATDTFSPQALGRQARPGVEAAQILDNLAQFRFYSAWRGAVERQRSGLLAG